MQVNDMILEQLDPATEHLAMSLDSIADAEADDAEDVKGAVIGLIMTAEQEGFAGAASAVEAEREEKLKLEVEAADSAIDPGPGDHHPGSDYWCLC